ncbi:hypothetical protein B0H16DRAFT_1697482 [Mycena metata]|uniref:Uncharacterized protein n=1 Tax=Mycena metata TaxID=1033252 RepID=A0AAD7HU31_9AGAR|nr:hypothetical protein B0H16DRAFT_1697482 [Mycena metata]
MVNVNKPQVGGAGRVEVKGKPWEGRRRSRRCSFYGRGELRGASASIFDGGDLVDFYGIDGDQMFGETVWCSHPNPDPSLPPTAPNNRHHAAALPARGAAVDVGLDEQGISGILGTGFSPWYAVAWRAAVAVLACPDVARGPESESPMAGSAPSDSGKAPYLRWGHISECMLGHGIAANCCLVFSAFKFSL